MEMCCQVFLYCGTSEFKNMLADSFPITIYFRMTPFSGYHAANCVISHLGTLYGKLSVAKDRCGIFP